MELKSFLRSKQTKIILYGIAGLIILLLAFKAGEFIGFRKAKFSYRWGENYYRSFKDSKRGMMENFRGRDFLMGQGVYGAVLSVSSSTVIVKDRDNAEKVVLIEKNTAINKLGNSASIGDIKENDKIIIIGSPDDGGQIEARFIRILPASSTPVLK